MNTIERMRALEKAGWDLSFIESPLALTGILVSKQEFESKKTLLCKLSNHQGDVATFTVPLSEEGSYESIFDFICNNPRSPMTTKQITGIFNDL